MSISLSYWEKYIIDNTDYLIVGSGIVGLSVAAELKEKFPHAKVCLLEKGPLSCGASTKNAGFFCFGSLTELIFDYEKFGIELMLANSLSRYQGLCKTLKRLTGYDIGFENCGGYDCVSENYPANIKEVNEKIAFLNDKLRPFFKEDVYVLEENYNGFLSTKAIVKNHLEGAVHTGKLFLSLLDYVRKLGVFILTGTEVNGFDEKDDKVTVHLSSANLPWADVNAKNLIFCTNAWISKLFPEEDVVPGRGQVVVSKPHAKQTLIPGTYHAEEGYYYFRTLPENRVLFGGGRHLFKAEEETYMLGNTEKVINSILAKYFSLFGEEMQVDYFWSGIMAFGHGEKKYLLKRKSPRIILAGRMNGIGLAQGANIAEELMTHILGNC